MQVVFDAKQPVAKIYLPEASISWKIPGLIEKGTYDNIVMSSFSINDKETVDIRRCFNGTNHIFTFGRNVQETVMAVQFLCFLGKDCSQSGNATGLKNLEYVIRDNYENCRVSACKKPLQITIGDLSRSGFLIDENIGQVNPSNFTCTLTFTFILNMTTR